MTTETETLDELKDRQNACYENLKKLRDRIAKLEDEPKAKALVGKCLTYRNSYSCPSKPSDYWNLYVRINKAKGSYVYVESFEKDKDGKIEFEFNKFGSYQHYLNSGYKSISSKKFEARRKQLIRELANKD